MSIREYYDNAAEPVTADEVLDPASDVVRPNRRGSRWAFAAVAAALAVFVLVGGPLVIFGLSDSSDPSVPPSTVVEPESPPRIDLGYETGDFASAGYACDGADTPDCGDGDLELTGIWIGALDRQAADMEVVDFIDFFMTVPTLSGNIIMPETQIELGLGVRIEPTNDDHGLVGESFVQITFSGVSAGRYLGNSQVRRTVQEDGSITWVWFEQRDDDPATMLGPILTFPDGTGANFITDMALVAFADNTMTWVVALNYAGPSQYDFGCSDFWGGMCQVRLAPGPER
jgi:hypothetical protein